MKEYLKKAELLKSSNKYSLYYDNEKDEFIIYNGFSVYSFGLDELGDEIYRGSTKKFRIQ
jgi:hypothetical protein